MHYKTIFLDWGGVIGSDPGDDFLGDLLLKIGATETQKDEILDTYKIDFMRGDISEGEYWQALRERYGLTIHDSISEEFQKWQGLNVNQKVLKLVHQAQAKKIKVAILSNVIEPTYNAIKQAGYYDLFDDVIASCKVGYAKPEKEIYILALQRLGVSSKESVFVDDKQKCITPAIELGFKTILAENENQMIKDLSELIRIN